MSILLDIQRQHLIIILKPIEALIKCGQGANFNQGIYTYDSDHQKQYYMAHMT